MLLNIVPDWDLGRTFPLDAGPLAFALERMTPALWSPAPGESPAECEARRLAGADIFDDLLAEYAAEAECGGVVAS